MSKQITVTRYSFEELSPEAQEKAIAREQDGLAEFCPNDLIEEQMLDKLGELLYGTGEAHKIPAAIELGSWDVNNSQGSTVHFIGDLAKELGQLITWPEGVASLTLSEDSFYGQGMTLFNVEGEEVDDDEKFAQVWRNIRGAVWHCGVDAYSDFCSEEAARDQLTDRDEEDKYIFLEDGTVAVPQGVAE